MNSKKLLIPGLSPSEKLFSSAVAVIVERIIHLPSSDRILLSECIKELISAETEEELADIQSALEEILDGAKTKPLRFMESSEGEPTPKLDKWLAFVSKRIKDLRTSAKMTQEQLAEKAEIPQSHVSRLENGRHSPTRLTLEKIATALGVDVRELDYSID